MNEMMQLIEGTIEEQKKMIQNLEKNLVNIEKNNMTEYMALEKRTMLNMVDLKEKEKEIIKRLNGEKISEKINKADIKDAEKEKMILKVEEMVLNYKTIDDILQKARIIIEPQVELGEIIFQTFNEEMQRVQSEGGNLYNEKI